MWEPHKGVKRVEHNTGTVGSATPGTSITTGAASGTKGTAVQLIAATTFDYYWLTIIASNYGLSATASQGCLDILTGAATEEVLIPNLLMGYCGSVGVVGRGPKRWDFPLYIPAGTRLAAQAAGIRTATALRVQFWGYGGDGCPPFRTGSKVTTYGVTVPDGVTIIPGSTGAEGAFAQITASTSEDHFALVPSFQQSATTTSSLKALAVDIGFGAAAEEEIAQSYWYSTDTGEFMDGPWNSMPTFQDIPAGTRLTMRASNSGTNDTAYNAAIHGIS